MVDAEGLHPLPSKLEAIIKAPKSENVQQLRSFLIITQSLWQIWPVSFIQLVSAKVLAHYDPDLPMKMAADASAYGVGAVIPHVYPNGNERPVAFASRTLTKSEKNYAQLEKEAFALIFGVKHFHQYLYARSFTLVTDHRPLTTILSPHKGIPSLAAARLQGWAIILSAYQYDIEFKCTQQHGNADALSRLPLPVDVTSET